MWRCAHFNEGELDQGILIRFTSIQLFKVEYNNTNI